MRSFYPFLLGALSPLLGAMTPVDHYGRPLLDDQGEIHYVWDGNRWLAHSSDGSGQPVSGPSPRKAQGFHPFVLATDYALEPYTTHPAGGGGGDAMAVAIGDVTGDARPDVVMIHDADLYVYAQQADGSLADGVYHYAPISKGGQVGLALADMNYDGILDVVVGDRYDMAILLADGIGGLEDTYISPLSSRAYSLAIGTFNQDPFLDYVGVTDRGTPVLGAGDKEVGHFDLAFLPGSLNNSREIEAEDINGDGLLDVVVLVDTADPPSSEVVLFAAPSFEQMTAAGNEPMHGGGIGLGDVTGNGRHDIVYSLFSDSSASLKILSQRPDGTFSPPITMDTAPVPQAVLVEDLNGDGYEDVIVAHGGWMSVGIYLYKPGVGLKAEILYDVPYASHYQPNAIAVGDISGDGCADIALASGQDGLVTLRGICIPIEEEDSDGDGIADSVDNCAFIANQDQANSDGDSHGDVCDNCALADNESQDNSDGDTFGNACDNCRFVGNDDQANSDADSLGNACDNCAFMDNIDQANGDGDSLGDACDNCPLADNDDQANSDADSLGNACDNCALVSNDDQADRDGDRVGNVCDCAPDEPTQPVEEACSSAGSAEGCHAAGGNPEPPVLLLLVLLLGALSVLRARRKRQYTAAAS